MQNTGARWIRTADLADFRWTSVLHPETSNPLRASGAGPLRPMIPSGRRLFSADGRHRWFHSRVERIDGHGASFQFAVAMYH